MARAILKGIPISPGIAIADLVMMRDPRLHEKRHITEAEVSAEMSALQKASDHVCLCLKKTIQDIPDNLSEYRDIISAQIELASDSRLLDSARARIRTRHICAAWALSETIEELSALFQTMPDPYLCDRAHDIRLIGQSLADFLDGDRKTATRQRKGVLAAHDLSPADVLDLKTDGISALLTVEGGVTSHTAILARGLKIPAVAGLGNLFKEAKSGEKVIVDGLSGLVILDPDKADLDFYKLRKDNYISFEMEVRGSASLPAVTRDGHRVSVWANLENPAELPSLDKTGAEGVGLYRTEFAYLGSSLPGEEALFQEYRDVIDHISPGRVIFRTLDLGSDKLISARDNLYEPNPALGLRGIRLALRKKEIFRTQLRALARAGYQGDMAIMLPMVSTLGELEETRALLEEVQEELEREKVPHASKIPLGIMVETPAAMMISDALAEHCDFLSIGTNDLLHYIMAIDRNNRHVAYLHEPLHPAFTRAIKRIIGAAHQAGKPVSVCGELASDPFMAALLLGLGIDRLSAAPRFVPGLKHMLRQLKVSDCAFLANRALEELNVLKTRSLIHEALQAAMGAELSFHNTFIPDNKKQ